MPRSSAATAPKVNGNEQHKGKAPYEQS